MFNFILKRGYPKKNRKEWKGVSEKAQRIEMPKEGENILKYTNQCQF